MGRVGLQLLAQTVEIHAQVLGLAAVLGSPDTLQQHAMREHLACMGDKLLQKGELYWRQPHLHPLKSHDVPRKVDLEVAKAFDAASKWYRLQLSTAQHGTHAGQEFFHSKR